MADFAKNVLVEHPRTLGLDLDTDDFTETQAIAAVARLTAGNVRLIGRLFTQVKRIMKINDLTTVIHTAASTTLVIGST
ncbi:ATP-binding protein [Rhodococcus globerulus]|uniref:ATP-binding protein n=1 Tax=Rhodococcus globerulus TaxID=33008 RepID=A0ABU4C3U2_RHOGO|nr:ATP-binding protein [Rhodococcus globerulus]MDV6271171.1 ATP-binding protein [Rhodococcus globerulus]